MKHQRVWHIHVAVIGIALLAAYGAFQRHNDAAKEKADIAAAQEVLDFDAAFEKAMELSYRLLDFDGRAFEISEDFKNGRQNLSQALSARDSLQIEIYSTIETWLPNFEQLTLMELKYEKAKEVRESLLPMVERYVLLATEGAWDALIYLTHSLDGEDEPAKTALEHATVALYEASKQAAQFGSAYKRTYTLGEKAPQFHDLDFIEASTLAVIEVQHGISVVNQSTFADDIDSFIASARVQIAMAEKAMARTNELLSGWLPRVPEKRRARKTLHYEELQALQSELIQVVHEYIDTVEYVFSHQGLEKVSYQERGSLVNAARLKVKIVYHKVESLLWRDRSVFRSQI